MENNPYATCQQPDRSPYATRNVILKAIGKNKTILDVGCNDGYLAKFADPSNSFYGIDYNEQAIQSAQPYYQQVICQDLNERKRLPWERKFEVLIFADVLEHLVDPPAVLDFLVRNYLKENGQVIISLPNIANWQIRWSLLWGYFNYQESGILDRTHLHFYTYESAHWLITGANLRVQKVLFGASKLGFFLSFFGFLKTMLATGIIMVAQKNPPKANEV